MTAGAVPRPGEAEAVEELRQRINGAIFGLSPEKCVAAAYPIIAEAVRAERDEAWKRALWAEGCGRCSRAAARLARDPAAAQEETR